MIKTLKYHIPIFSMISAMCDQYGNDVIQEPKHVISFIKVSLQCCCVVDKDGGDIVSGDAFKNETLQMALTMLSMIVGSAKEVCFRGSPVDWYKCLLFLRLLKLKFASYS